MSVPKQVINVWFTCALITAFSFQANSTQSLQTTDLALQTFDQKKQATLNEFADLKANYHQRFLKQKQKLRQYWDTPKLSNKSQWVQYKNNNQIRQAVDFKNETITIEIIDNGLNESQIKQLAQEQLVALENQSLSAAIGNDQVLAVNNKTNIDSLTKALPGFAAKSSMEKVKVSQYQQKNGLNVARVSLNFPKSVSVEKAKSYLPDILRTAKKWQIPPDLLLAIIHTESHFNPLSQSHIPAYGLMQIVPTTAGKDVTARYLGKAQILPESILFNPKLNIDIGSAYLDLLLSHYLKLVDNNTTRTYLAIAAYNGGIGAVSRFFSHTSSTKKLAESVNKMTSNQVYLKLSQEFPFAETRHFLIKVSQHRTRYANFLAKQTT